MDRQKPGVTKSQPGFIDFVVRPLFETWVSAFFFVSFSLDFPPDFCFRFASPLPSLSQLRQDACSKSLVKMDLSSSVTSVLTDGLTPLPPLCCPPARACRLHASQRVVCCSTGSIRTTSIGRPRRRRAPALRTRPRLQLLPQLAAAPE